MMKKRMKSRWDLHCQREGGTKPMWEVLSFSGKFDPNFFDNLEDPGPPPDEATRDQRHWTSRASKARNRLRQGMNAIWQRQAILDGRTPKPAPLTRQQQHLLELYKNGELLEKANELTLLSGNGYLHREDGEILKIGDSEGGFTRRFLYGWKGPKVVDFFTIIGR